MVHFRVHRTYKQYSLHTLFSTEYTHNIPKTCAIFHTFNSYKTFLYLYALNPDISLFVTKIHTKDVFHI
jgi:hypothetical protein